MNEQNWLTSDEPRLLRDYLEQQRGPGASLLHGVSRRRLQLLACACVRRAWAVLPDERCRQAVEVAERFADGTATLPEREAAGYAARCAREEINRRTRNRETARQLYNLCNEAGLVADTGCTAAIMSGFSASAEACGAKTHNDLVRCIFGNPFRPVQLDPAWLAWNDGAVRKLAQVIYDERRFGDLPLLADALEDAGCCNADILAHCRSGTEHARGCFALDLLLDKK